MTKSAFAESLRQEIEREYKSRGDNLGWRLLYSPELVVESARIAFLGMNPGGAYKPTGHPEFAMPRGSAYILESWGGVPPARVNFRDRSRTCSIY